ELLRQNQKDAALLEPGYHGHQTEQQTQDPQVDIVPIGRRGRYKERGDHCAEQRDNKNRFLFEKSQHRVRFYHKMHLPLTTTIIPIYLERCKRKSGNLPLTFRGKMRNLISCETRLTRR